MRLNSLASKTLMVIENIIETNVYEYYLRLNSGDFVGVAQLFSENGFLHPPFEKAIFGREAIAQYLQSEAKAIEAYPKSGTLQELDNGSNLYQIQGYVKTSYFTINVGWKMRLNADKEITSVEIKLLAELQDLLALKRT
jgi:hypothetical protein